MLLSTDGRTFSQKDSCWVFSMLEKVANKPKSTQQGPFKLHPDFVSSLNMQMRFIPLVNDF